MYAEVYMPNGSVVRVSGTESMIVMSNCGNIILYSGCNQTGGITAVAPAESLVVFKNE